MSDSRPTERPRTTTNPGAMKAVTAARAKPLPSQSKAISAGAIKSQATDTALNVMSLLRDTWEDFQNSERYFKYKAGIIGAWLLVSIVSVFLAMPESGVTNDLGAQVVTTEVAGRAVYMIKNDSTETWNDVEVVVNRDYKTRVAQIPPNGDITLTHKQLVGPKNVPAPEHLKVFDLEIRTSEGRTVLLKNGHPP